MYKVTWDIETGGVRLNHKVVADTLSVSPRPVFFEELDLLKINELGWSYPHCEEPLLWACNKQYFYRGQLVFEAKGANIYDDASVDIKPGFESLTLEPVNMDEMLRRNQDILFLLESEAIEFIRDTFIDYSVASKKFEEFKANQLDFEALAAAIEKRTKRKMAIVKEDCDSFDLMDEDSAQRQGKKRLLTTKIDVFLASFSGGKDSQVVLDLCTRALPPSVFEVIYSDTGYELPSSLDLYEDVKRHYSELFPGLKFSTARNHASVLSYWDKIGTPSDTHRWCCSVMKTAPLYRSLKVPGTNKQARVLTFDGVRAEESTRRSNYNRIGKGVKHSTVINAHPILNWNTTEIFLYLFTHSLPINLAYRLGKARVGCLICPFSTAWDDMVTSKSYPTELSKFTKRIEDWATENGDHNVREYLASRNWKIKAIGDMKISRPSVRVVELVPNFTAIVSNSQFDIFSWLPALCKFTQFTSDNLTQGQLQYKDKLYNYIIENNDNGYIFNVVGVLDIKFSGLLKRIVYKSAFCIQCEACEVECPTGALTVYPQLKIDKTKCVHCLKCVMAHDQGCIAADCTRMIEDRNKKATAKVKGYKTFGLREEWLSEFLSDAASFWKDNSLGNAQIDSLKGWLKDAEILDIKNNLTPFGKLLEEIYIDEPNFTWEAILINLAYNSFIVNWFANTISFNKPFDKKALELLISEEQIDSSPSTIKNAISALMELIRLSPIGDRLNYGQPQGKEYVREQYDSFSDMGVAYALYKFAEKIETKSFRVADVFDEENQYSPAKILGISMSDFEKALRTLNSANNRVLIAELNMGLDHITLRDDLNALSVVKQML